MLRFVAAAVLVITPAIANAEVVDRSPAGFTVKSVVTIAASPERSFRALVDDIGRWWEPSHTLSGDAGNLRIDARPGGCFCETLPKGGGVAHAVVTNVVPGELVRMSGALGPLQEHAVVGTLTVQFASAGQGTTATLTYAVAGSFPGGLEKAAAPVDKVLSDQLHRLKTYLEGPAQRSTNPQGPIDPERMTPTGRPSGPPSHVISASLCLCGFVRGGCPTDRTTLAARVRSAGSRSAAAPCGTSAAAR